MKNFFSQNRELKISLIFTLLSLVPAVYMFRGSYPVMFISWALSAYLIRRTCILLDDLLEEKIDPLTTFADACDELPLVTINRKRDGKIFKGTLISTNEAVIYIYSNQSFLISECSSAVAIDKHGTQRDLLSEKE